MISVDSIPHKILVALPESVFEMAFQYIWRMRNLEFQQFHKLLVCNLERRHKEEPTHNLEELLHLRQILRNRQELVLGKNVDGLLCAAAWVIKATKEIWHVQYIARDHTRNVACAVEATLCGAMEVVRDLGAKYLNLGICTENGGTVLNTGLLRFKRA